MQNKDIDMFFTDYDRRYTPTLEVAVNDFMVKFLLETSSPSNHVFLIRTLIDKMKVPELKSVLKSIGCQVSGKKSDLLTRISVFLSSAGSSSSFNWRPVYQPINLISKLRECQNKIPLSHPAKALLLSRELSTLISLSPINIFSRNSGNVNPENTVIGNLIPSRNGSNINRVYSYRLNEMPSDNSVFAQILSNVPTPQPRALIRNNSSSSNGNNNNSRGTSVNPPVNINLQDFSLDNPQFAKVPFYRIEHILTTKVFEPHRVMEKRNEHVVFTIKQEHWPLLDTPEKLKEHRVFVLCGQVRKKTENNAIELEWPIRSAEIMVNNKKLEGKSHLGLKGKPKTAKPADITDLIKNNHFYGQYLSIEYEVNTESLGKLFALQIVIVQKTPLELITMTVVRLKYVGIDDILKAKLSKKRLEKRRLELNKRSGITDTNNSDNALPSKKEETTANEDKAIESDDDIEVAEITLSFNDPVSMIRIKNPARASTCSHLQCFDLDTYFSLNEIAPTWRCPVCNKDAIFSKILVDGYFQDLMNKMGSNAVSVKIDPVTLLPIEDSVINESEDNDSGSDGEETSNNLLKSKSKTSNSRSSTYIDDEIIILD